MTDRNSRDMHQQNRLSWNEATRAHNSHKADQGSFLREGGSTLFPEEIALLGDVTGQSVLHLLCNSGQDSLSIARLGAAVTGVDISDVAIATAQALSAASGIRADFHRADALDWLDEAQKRDAGYDIAFLSYGAICWISCLDEFMQKTADVLKDDGRLILMEFHPILSKLNPDGTLRASSFSGAVPTKDDGVDDYVRYSGHGLVPSGYLPGEEDFQNPEPNWLFYWNMGEILAAVTSAGFHIEAFEEFPYANGYCPFISPSDKGERRFGTPEGVADLPLMFGLTGVKR